MATTKSILLKLFQVVLFTFAIIIYLEVIGKKDNESQDERTERKKNEFYKWFAGIILFSIAWSIGTFKVLSNILLSFFVVESIQQFIQHLPAEYYEQFKEIISNLLIPFAGENFTKEIVGVQCLLILFFSFLGFNIYLADKFWLLKTIIIDWVLTLILMVAFSITDLLNQQTRVFLVLSYIFGSNIIGFGTIKLLEYFWNLASKLDSTIIIKNNNNIIKSSTTSKSNSNQKSKNLDDSIEFDTDNHYNNTGSTTTAQDEEPIYQVEESVETVEKVLIEENGQLIEEEIKIDNIDYTKLTESELDAILSEPIQESQVSTRNLVYHKSTKFINNLMAPENINQRISAKEFVGVIILWVYAMSNLIIENYSIFTTANILVFIGFSGTILSYLSTISAKRLTSKNPSKREC
ncbi:hypothetical protein DICPUDRAFT_88938 [Dictyostelium purpureum]|uniref:Uncharacterized protein n=1 Tax=Dictyostelium purpureum TaxID=5786 RepID=F0ZSM4_DICPU|nr:uncharacterized protein DICPUDRAFT_88938 [Dictyostelium purpureum]EGC33071.1 hypothetical protein DICPUDRAFT_88938 [Dictyostelium purpureum]|eukprot:XP_003290421.1 hypothetical protein DICPUDRAFT_88938 [Dictyostelium purpureum]